MADDPEALELALVKQIGRDGPEAREMRERLHDAGTGAAIPIGRGRRPGDTDTGLPADDGAARRIPRGA